MRSSTRGFTLTELIVTAAVIGILVPLLARNIRQLIIYVNKSFVEWRSRDEVRPADVMLDQELLEMVQIQVAGTDRIQFVLDSHRMPGYNPDADSDGDGVRNLIDPDLDGDADSFVSPDRFLFIGNNLDDDDDDGDGKVDLQVRYVCDGNTLVRESRVNEAPWERGVVARNLSTCGFDYFGSANWTGRVVPDAGPDGDFLTMDTGQGDGIITAREIDWTLPPDGVGNRSGDLDTPAELALVAFVSVNIATDLNGDGVPETLLNKQIGPPLIAGRRWRP
jgi:prepilin-type N-terminal cleavage/methylation domain-containing protein